jgi:DNA-binding transcriptional ArsR family regulator
VLAVLIFRSNKFGKCWPSLTDIAEQSGLRYSRISGHTKRLKEFGYIDKKLMKKGTNNLLIYTVFSQVICQEVYPVSGETIYPVSGETIYPVSGETIYPVSGETTPIYIKPITLNIEKDATVSSKRLSVFSIDEILQIKIPEILSQETGFIPAWKSWVKTKVDQPLQKHRFLDAEEVKDLLQEMSEWFADGLDIIDGLKTAKRKKWKDCRKHYFHDLSNVNKPKLSKSQEIDKAFDDLRKKNDGDIGIRNERDIKNSNGNILEFSSERIHSESVGAGVKRLLS